jgi:hypothetical protein
MSKRVYPVEGRFLMDVPHVEHDCDDKNCLASGAFTDKPPSKASTKAPDKPGPSDSTDKE